VRPDKVLHLTGAIDMTTVVLVLIAILLTSCEPRGTSNMDAFAYDSQLPVSMAFEQVGFQPGASSGVGTFFVVVAVGQTQNDQAQRDLTNIGRNLCRDQAVCFVHFWSDLASAARSLPMSRSQVNAQIASYNNNTATGNDGLVCHPFGAPGERCSAENSAVESHTPGGASGITPGSAAPARNAWHVEVIEGGRVATTTLDGWSLMLFRVSGSEAWMTIVGPKDRGWAIDENRPPLVFVDRIEQDWFATGRAYEQVKRELDPKARSTYRADTNSVSTVVWHGRPAEGMGAVGELLTASSLRLVVFLKPFQSMTIDFSLQGFRQAVREALDLK
jgi:hypothetical protein